MSGERIELKGLRVLGRCGAGEEERAVPQPLEIDLEVVVDLTGAAASDELADTVDYAGVCDRVAEVVTAQAVALLEHLAELLAQAVLELDGRIEWVVVAVRKLRPPVPYDLASAGVSLTRFRAQRLRAFLGLGSNVGEREEQLRRAVAGLPDVVGVSPVYETEPVGGPAQERYLNAVVELVTERSPRQLLDVARALEHLAGREAGERFGPRPLDVDVLLVGDLNIDEADLVVPHPRMWARRFVLAPLADLAPELVAPGALASSHGQVRRLELRLDQGA